MKKNSILQTLLEEAHEANLNDERLLAIFDLDSTLFDLTKRVQEILLDFARSPKWSARYTEICTRVLNVEVSPRDWAISESLERIGILEKDHPDFYKDVWSHWREKFFSNEFLHHDNPLPGAPEFVKALERENATIMYLTGRDVARMEKGTIESLKQWGFPLDDDHVELVLKPDIEIDDAEFKAAVIGDCAQEFDRIWLFENEPVNLNLIKQTSPKVQLVFIDTTHSRREKLAPGLSSIPHFEVDMKAFEEFRAKKK